MKLEYRSNNFFNEKDQFVFYSGHEYFVDRCHLYNGMYYTNSGLQFKCTTVKASKLNH